MGHTWASLRQSYWIVKGSVTVRRVIGNCVFCKKRIASVGQQLMADLLLGRLQVNEPPFLHVKILNWKTLCSSSMIPCPDPSGR